MTRAILVPILLLAVMTLTIGSASAKAGCADCSIAILPDSGPNVAPNGVILAPVGQDASVSVGLAAEYKNFSATDNFSVTIINDTNDIVFFANGILNFGSTSDRVFDAHWVVPDDLGQSYTIIADGTDINGNRVTYVKAMAPIQPIPVSPLVLAGFALVAGIIWIRKK